MKNLKFWLIMVVMVFGLLFMGCYNDVLDGKWIFEDNTQILEFKKGKFILSLNGKPWTKGTFTIDENIISQTVTHVYGGNDYFTDPEYESKWYNKIELDILKIDDEYERLFSTLKRIFSINEKELRLISDTYTSIFTKE